MLWRARFLFLVVLCHCWCCLVVSCLCGGCAWGFCCFFRVLLRKKRVCPKEAAQQRALEPALLSPSVLACLSCFFVLFIMTHAWWHVHTRARGDLVGPCTGDSSCSEFLGVPGSDPGFTVPFWLLPPCRSSMADAAPRRGERRAAAHARMKRKAAVLANASTMLKSASMLWIRDCNSTISD